MGTNIAVHNVTLPVTVDEAVGLGSARVLVGNGNPEDGVLAEKSAAQRQLHGRNINRSF